MLLKMPDFRKVRAEGLSDSKKVKRVLRLSNFRHASFVCVCEGLGAVKWEAI